VISNPEYQFGYFWLVVALSPFSSELPPASRLHAAVYTQMDAFEIFPRRLNPTGGFRYADISLLEF
jgi:hypothetical protein